MNWRLCLQTSGIYRASAVPGRPKTSKTGGASLARPQPGPAPESALRLHPCRALSSAPVQTSVAERASPSVIHSLEKELHAHKRGRYYDLSFRLIPRWIGTPIFEFTPHWNETHIPSLTAGCANVGRHGKTQIGFPLSRSPQTMTTPVFLYLI